MMSMLYLHVQATGACCPLSIAYSKRGNVLAADKLCYILILTIIRSVKHH
jgi:hypothetical protein